MSYLEPGYHKPGDKPFTFPPEGVESKTDANLIGIYGRNGTGKTTLLNVLALALGYLDREKELETKQVLRRKLQALQENETLEYDFRICRNKPTPVDLRLERGKGQKQRIYLNSKPIGPETLSKEFDVVFLTEDDPRKVITANKGKLARYFMDLGENRLKTLGEALNKHALEIDEFHNFKNDEQRLLNEIRVHQKTIERDKEKLDELREKMKKIGSRDEIKKKLELLNNQEKIGSEYRGLKGKHEQLKGKKDAEIIQKIYKERLKLSTQDTELNNIRARIVQTCDSLAQYGVTVHSDRLLRDDYTEFNKATEEVRRSKKDSMIKIAIVDEMIELLQRHQGDEVVPLINKPVREALSELYKMKMTLRSDRVFGLLTALGQFLSQRQETVKARDKIQEKINDLSRDLEDLKSVEDIEKAFVEAEKKYIALQDVLQQDKTKMLSEWNQLRSVKGDSKTVSNELQELEVQVRTEENLKSMCQHKLEVLRENASAKPKYQGKEKGLKALNDMITKLRENLYHWSEILVEKEKRESFAPKGPGFGLANYEKFVRAIGEFLGKQFEPVPYDNRFHEIKFFDIEQETFTTKEDRQIPIERLSQGQSKIATLTGSFKEMGQDKNKIVLIDEIADLDPENLEKVKNTLREKFSEGSLLLAVLVRPTQDPSSRSVEIIGWS